MFSTSVQSPHQIGRALAAVPASTRPGRRPNQSHTLEEAYEMRLLAQVVRCEDQSAFEEIYANHHAAVMRVARHVCRDAGGAEEIVQQTFTALWVRAARLLERSVRLRPWLTTVARNAAIDRLRAEVPVTSIDEVADSPSCAISPEDSAVARDSKAALTAALATLSSEQRTAVELVYTAGLTYAAAADALGEPIGTIKSRVRLAIGHLRVQMQPVAY
jgi:RNA polymerase sigma-70 factor (ECF subfamily)